MELKERVKAYINYLFSFDLKNIDTVTVEVTKELENDVTLIGNDWDHLDGFIFTDLVHKAMDKVESRDPQLFTQ